MQKRDLNKVALQLYLNSTNAGMHPQKSAPYSEHTLLQKNTSGGLLVYVKRILIDLNYKKLLFTVVKKSPLTLISK